MKSADTVEKSKRVTRFTFIKYPVMMNRVMQLSLACDTAKTEI